MRRRLPIDYALRNLRRRPGRTLLTGTAATLVTAVLVLTVAFQRALERSFVDQGRSDTALLISSASMRDIVRSAIPPAAAELVAADVPGITRIHGVAAVSPEIHMASKLGLGEEGSEEHAAFLRGVTERALLVHEAVTVVQGRLPATGEVLVGQVLPEKLGVEAQALAPGSRIRFEGATWTVSGVFAAPGTTIESEIWVPLRELQSVARRDDISCVFVRMEDASGIGDVEVFAQRRLDLELTSIPASAYYRELASYFAPIRTLGWTMAVLIGIAALLTGANSLNTTVQDRLPELATLRALGYPGSAIALSLALEAIWISAAGGLVGVALAVPALKGATFRIAMGAFRLEADGPAVLTGLLGAVALGTLGSLPALRRALTLPVARALQSD
ncbi:MAG: ABC transporter permease [Planctomycetota bacterium]